MLSSLVYCRGREAKCDRTKQVLIVTLIDLTRPVVGEQAEAVAVRSQVPEAEHQGPTPMRIPSG